LRRFHVNFIFASISNEESGVRSGLKGRYKSQVARSAVDKQVLKQRSGSTEELGIKSQVLTQRSDSTKQLRSNNSTVDSLGDGVDTY
jgi:hypothetical protein